MFFRLIMRFYLAGIVPLLLLTLGASGTATATPLNLDYSGVLEATSTLGGTAFGASTLFTFQAGFDSSAPIDFGGGGGGAIYAVTSFSIDITGYGTFTGVVPDADLNVLVLDPSFSGFYALGLVSGDLSNGFYGTYDTATPPFAGNAPIPSVLSGYLGTASGSYTIQLSGVSGGLVINGIENHTAALVAVPEPSSLLLFASGGVLFGLAAVRRRSAHRRLPPEHRPT